MLRKLIIAAMSSVAIGITWPAMAADLDYGPVARSPYDDPRFSDVYRHPAPPPRPRYAEPYPPPPVYREERFVAPPPPPPYRQDGRFAGDCIPRHVIRDRLERHGWHAFQDPQVAGNVVHIRARRPNGRPFDLTVDRCSGEVLAAEPYDERSAYAVPPPERPWQEPRYRPY